jgi:hypothetical protein
MDAVIKQIQQTCFWIERGQTPITCWYNCLYVLKIKYDDSLFNGHHFHVRGSYHMSGVKNHQDVILNMYRDEFRNDYGILSLNYWFSNSDVLKRGYFSSARQHICDVLQCIFINDLINIVADFYN